MRLTGKGYTTACGKGIVNNTATQVKHILHQRFTHDLLRRALRVDAPVMHCHPEVVGIAAGQIEIVQHHHNGFSLLAIERA